MKYTLLNSRGVAVITLVSVHFSIAAALPPDGGPVSWSDLGSLPTVQHCRDRLAFNPTPTGAQVRCDFQRLEGDVSTEGLWLRSATDRVPQGNFRVLAVRLTRNSTRLTECLTHVPDEFDWTASELAATGVVRVLGDIAQFIRDGVTEEYSVSVDGVRQDFIIAEPPMGAGELRAELEVVGATARPMANGVRLTLNKSGREFAYHRLHVTDARGRELPARWDIIDAATLSIVVDDASALYPVRAVRSTRWRCLGAIFTQQAHSDNWGMARS